MSATRTFVIILLGLAAGLGRGQYLEAVVRVGYTPVALLWNPVSNKVYCSNEQDNTVTIIDGANNDVIATVSVGESPDFLAWNSRSNKVYVSCGEADRVAVIDGVGDTLLRSVRIHGYPNRLAYCETLDKLYVCRFDDMAIEVLDAGPDTAIATIRLWSTPMTLMWHPRSNRIFCSAWSDADTIFIIDCVTDQVTSLHTLARYPYAWAWNPINDFAYVAGWQAAYAFSADGDSVVATMPVSGRWSQSACWVPHLNKLYVGDFNHEDGITLIDCNTNATYDTIPIDQGVDCMLCDTVHGKVYVGCAPEVQVFDGRTDSLLVVLQLGAGLFSAMAWNRTDSRVYLAVDGTYDVYVLRDTSPGISEQGRQLATGSGVVPTFVGRWLDAGDHKSPTLVDVTGRMAARLHAGSNDLGGLEAGVYFLQRGRDVPAAKVIVRR